jgi:pyroglutamyl-peptidase
MKLPLLLLALLLHNSISAAEPVTILLTAYGPFAGRGLNGSETVARSLDGTDIGGARIHIVVLPVRWGEPEKIVPTAVNSLHPRLILGLGEGHPEQAAVEQLAVNRAEHADEAGIAPPALLATDGPAQRRSTMRFERSWFATDAAIRLSNDAGTYLCNNMLYVAAGQSVPAAGFMHLPPQGNTPSAEYIARWAPLVRTFISHNLTP